VQKFVGVIYCWRTPGMPPEMMTRVMSSGNRAKFKTVRLKETSMHV